MGIIVTEGRFADVEIRVKPEAIQAAVERGRLLEMIDVIARETAASISSQFVNEIARAAVTGKSIKDGIGMKVGFTWEDDEFGTHPPRAKFVLAAREELSTPLRELVAERQRSLSR